MATPAIPTLLPLQEAAQRYGLDIDTILTLIDAGKIKAARVGEQIVVSEYDVQREAQPITKEDLQEYKKHAYLKGHSIWISEASRKYGITQPTISNWVKSGVIKVLGRDKNRKLIDEADVAYRAEVYRKRQGQGKWLFDEKGLPYRHKAVPLAI